MSFLTSDYSLTVFMHKPSWMHSYKFNMKSLFHHCFVNYFLFFPASYHFVCFKSFCIDLFSFQTSLGNICWVKKSFLFFGFNDKVFPSSFFSLKDSVGETVDSNLACKHPKQKGKKNSISLNKHTFPKSGRYTRTFTCFHAKKIKIKKKPGKKETQRTKMKTNSFPIQICMTFSQQTGSLEKQIST